jgi:hypothetical protein
MKRILALALVVTLGYTPLAFAADSLVQSGQRHARLLATTTSVEKSDAAKSKSHPGSVPSRATEPSSMFQESGGNLARSSRSRAMKALIFIGIGVGFAASAYAIDHHVLDVTPSSRGTRQD